MVRGKGATIIERALMKHAHVPRLRALAVPTPLDRALLLTFDSTIAVLTTPQTTAPRMSHTTDATAAAIGVYCNVCWETHDVHSIYVLPCGKHILPYPHSC